MNWLAHILLSKRDVEYQLGNLLADPFKGKLWPRANQSLHDGVQMHKSIDIFTDSHEIVVQCKARLGTQGYLKGVVVDLLFDHFLSQSWNNYSELPLDEFVEKFHNKAQKLVQEFPTQEGQFIERVINSKLLLSYKNFDGFINSLQRVENRLSDRIKRKDSTNNYIALVEKNYSKMKEDFNIFFPSLISHFKDHELGDKKDTYLL
jgi:acyl carrier protein phosphodiesterase